MPKVAVIICTRNRARHLAEALQTFENCIAPADWQADLIVVDNGSTDETKAVATAKPARGTWPLTYVYEPKPGLSHARNAGLRAADADILAFTDDDCRAASDWIVQLVRTFESCPELDAVFGRVEAVEGADIRRTVAVKQEENARDYRHPVMPTGIGHGNNMAFRRTALEKVGAFDAALGAGGALGAAEDTDMAYRVLRLGRLVRYEPSCVIRHEPREDEAQVRRTHWRNAVGMGAFFSKHFLRGDFFALKCWMWMMLGLPSAALKERRAGHREDLAAKRLYFFGLPYGAFARLWFDLTHGFPKEERL